MLILTLLALTGTLSAAPSDTTVSDVAIPTTVVVAGQTLSLNGAGVRKKFVVKVYVGALYLATKSTSASAVLAADEPRQMVLSFVHDVDKGKLCEAWNDALTDNSPDASAQLKADFVTLCGWMEDVKDKQQIVFTYVPGTGTEVVVAGKSKGTIAGKEFADAILKAWIGPKPGPGDGFKKQVLGGS